MVVIYKSQYYSINVIFFLFFFYIRKKQKLNFLSSTYLRRRTVFNWETRLYNIYRWIVRVSKCWVLSDPLAIFVNHWHSAHPYPNPIYAIVPLILLIQLKITTSGTVKLKGHESMSHEALISTTGPFFIIAFVMLRGPNKPFLKLN